MSAQFETLNQVVETVVPFVDQKSMDVSEVQPETKPKTKKELKMTKKTKKLITLCGKLYSFDGEEAITRLLNYEKPKKEKKAKEPRKRKSVASNPDVVDKKNRGRPAKTVKVVEESQVVDMFADIVSKDDDSSEEITAVELVETTEKKAPKTKRAPKNEEDKAQEKAEKDAKKAQEKAEKDAKKAQEKLEKDAKKAQEKLEKEEAKKSKSNKSPKKSKKSEKLDNEATKTAVSDTESDQESEKEEVFKVKKFEYNGVSYLRTRNNDEWHENGHIYNMDQDLVGFWCDSEKTIKFLEEGECSEEEYEE